VTIRELSNNDDLRRLVSVTRKHFSKHFLLEKALFQAFFGN